MKELGCPQGSGNSLKGFKERAIMIFVLQRLCRSDWKNDKNGGQLEDCDGD